MGFVVTVKGPPKLKLPTWKHVVGGCCTLLAPFCLVLMAFNCGHAPIWKHYRLINKSRYQVRVMFEDGFPGIAIEPYMTGADPERRRWDTLMITYTIQKLAPAMESDEYY